jgi:PhzF family phenazine biosynthesis protein
VHPNAKKLAFQSRWRGILGATLESELGQGARIGLDLPTVVTPPAAKAAEWTTALAGALGISESDFVRVVEYDFGEPSAIAEVKESVDIKALKPDFTKISEVVPLVVVTNVNTAKSAPENLDVDSRVFAPGFGIDEDPVVSLVSGGSRLESRVASLMPSHLHQTL